MRNTTKAMANPKLPTKTVGIEITLSIYTSPYLRVVATDIPGISGEGRALY